VKTRRSSTLASRRWAAVLATISTLAVPAIAHAGGFEFPDVGARSVGRGGAYAVGAADLTALHYNPGALAKQRGTTILYNHNLTFHDTRFQRATLSDAWGDDAGTTFPEVQNDRKLFALGPFLAVASDFGLENWTFAAGFYGPSAVGRHDYPEYGPQSFMLTDMNVLLAYYSVAAAWKLRDVFGVGVTLQYVDLISLKYALVTDSTVIPDLSPVPDPGDTTTPSTQLVTELDLKDRFSGTAIVGMWYRPHRRVELGVASRVVPVFLKAKGGLNTDKTTLLSDDVTVELPMTLPAIVRGGVRYIHAVEDREWFDLELSAQYENWSVIDAFDLNFDGEISGMPIQDLSIQKKWKDTVSVRLGGDYNVLPPYLTVRAGGFWESGAMRENYSHLDFPSFMRGGIGAGLSGGYKGIYLTVGYMHIFQEDREVSEAGGKQYQERPLRPCPDGCAGASGVPANAGTFTSQFDLLSLGLEVRFRELLGDRRARRKKAEGGTPAPTTPSPATPANETAAPDAAPAPATSTPTGDTAPEEGSAPAPADETTAPEPAGDTATGSPAEGGDVPDTGGDPGLGLG
jgi:long-subunit fatty acid transport protein